MQFNPALIEQLTATGDDFPVVLAHDEESVIVAVKLSKDYIDKRVELLERLQWLLEPPLMIVPV